MDVTIQKIIGSSDGNPDNGLTARNKINSNFQNLVDAILSIQVEAGTTSFENLTNKPSTLQGYGITDAASINHTHTFISITNKPTTLLGYGILDAANINHTHDYIPLSQKGSINGVASLNDSGIIISSQLPSYVDDVIEVSTYSSLPVTGESGKIYVTIDDNLTYRWTGSIYVEISKSIALGETSSTAYRGDLGAIAYAHSQIAGGTGVHISDTERTNWNISYTNNHTHINKSLLDAFSQSDNDVLNHLSIVDGKLKVDIDLYSLGEVASYGVGSTGGTSYINAALSLSSTLTTASDIYSGGNIHLNNEMYIKGKNTTGTYYQLFGVDGSNYVKYGDVGLTSIFKGSGILMSTASKNNIITIYDTIGLNANTSVTGTITSTGTGTFTGGSFSSLRKLKNIHNDWKGNALNEIGKLKIRSFNYKNNPLINKTLGLIVDEIPESISEYLLMGENKDSINLYTLHSLSLLGLQQTKTDVDLLKDKISELENRIKELENN